MAEKNCLFCAIAAGSLPAKIIDQNDDVMAFHDINPAAPHHFLVIPKKHIVNINDLDNENADVMGTMALMAKKAAQALHIHVQGFRYVINTEAAAGQTVFHLHAHVLAGRAFSWPPG